MSVTIKHVAELAGVSPRTVSNVVNEFVHVKPATRDRVQAAIAQLGYVPNIAARNLRRGKTGMIGYAVPELSQPYFAELGELLEHQAGERGYTLISTQTGGAKQRELAMLRRFNANLVDGLIFSPMQVGADDVASGGGSVPLVLIGEQIEHPGLATFAIDNDAAVRDATAHLAKQGRRAIAALGAFHDDAYRPSIERMAGYREGMISSGLALDESLVLYTDRFSRSAGYEAVMRAWNNGVRFDALVCFTDMLAFGASRALADLGVAVGSTVAVVGMDDVQEAAFHLPSLTSIRPDKAAIVDLALDALEGLIAGESVAGGRVAVPYTLEVRESSTTPA